MVRFSQVKLQKAGLWTTSYLITILWLKMRLPLNVNHLRMDSVAEQRAGGIRIVSALKKLQQEYLKSTVPSTGVYGMVRFFHAACDPA